MTDGAQGVMDEGRAKVPGWPVLTHHADHLFARLFTQSKTRQSDMVTDAATAALMQGGRGDTMPPCRQRPEQCDSRLTAPPAADPGRSAHRPLTVRACKDGRIG